MTFQVRTGETPAGDDSKTEPYTLSGTEFVRRWSMHILPKGYTKTRRYGGYGGYSNYHRNRYIEECKELLPPSANLEETSQLTTDCSKQSRHFPTCLPNTRPRD